MKGKVKIIASTALMMLILFNTTCFAASWGVDEQGKYPFDKMLVVVKKEHSADSAAVIKHLSERYSLEKITILSDEFDEDEPTELVLMIRCSYQNENDFNELMLLLSEDDRCNKTSVPDAFDQLLHIFIHSHLKWMIRKVINQFDGNLGDMRHPLYFSLLICHKELIVPSHAEVDPLPPFQVPSPPL